MTHGIGYVSCWGDSNKKQIGSNDSYSNSPQRVGGNDFTNNIQVSGGHEHTCSVKVDGSVWCWGGKNWGKLGNGQNENTSTQNPVRVKGVDGNGFLTGMIQVSAGDEHTCALHHSGTAYCWGSQEDGRLTQSGSGARNTPYLVRKSSLKPSMVSSKLWPLGVTLAPEHLAIRLFVGGRSRWSSGQWSDRQRTIPRSCQRKFYYWDVH